MIDPQEAADRIEALSAESLTTLLANDKCPLCIGELDTGYECNACGFDAMALAQMIGQDELAKARKPVEQGA